MKTAIFTFILLAFAVCFSGKALAASNNVPLDSPVYLYLEKLQSLGLVSSDFSGIRPFSKDEAARLTIEASKNFLAVEEGLRSEFANDLIHDLRENLKREISLQENSESEQESMFSIKPFSEVKLRYVYLDGVPRSYERPVHDPGNDGVFGIGSGLRPANPYPSPVQQHGSEGTPLMENNQGVSYTKGSNVDLRFSTEAFAGSFSSALIEPMLLYNKKDSTKVRLNKGYLKLGGGALELEVGRDENWLGMGQRGNITLTNNARNFDQIKLSSPEPLITKYLWPLKYAFIFSQFEKTTVDGNARQPFFLAAKLSMKPTANLEFGINMGRQVGGPGVNNSLGSTLRGFVGGTNSDNSNTLAGLEFRWRISQLRNMELYGEFSGEDSALFWPIVESYVAGIYIPRLTTDGKNDLRFEYFRGNNILYTNGTFPEGYLHNSLPIGHSQGGATDDYFARFTHWFSLRNRVSLDYIHTRRGDRGRVTANSASQFDPNGVMQAVEKKNSGRVIWNFPLSAKIDANIMGGIERVSNMNLVSGVQQTNKIVKVELTFRF